MIRVYTKTRHVDSIHKFLDLINLEHEIFTTKNPPSPEHELEPFDLGVSYSYPRKITKNLLSIPPKGFVNYHAAPLPEYKGWLVYEEAIENKDLKPDPLKDGYHDHGCDMLRYFFINQFPIKRNKLIMRNR